MEQRRTQRYKLQLPLHIIQVGDQRVDLVEQTRDISSAGVSFLSPNSVEVGDRVEYLVTLSGSTPPVRIRCLGKVARTWEPSLNGGGSCHEKLYEIAVTLERYQFVRPGERATLPTTVAFS